MNKLFKITNVEEGMTAFITFPEEAAENGLQILKDAAKENGKQFDFEVFSVGKMPLEALPEDIQKQVRGTLKAFARCNVVYEHGRFSAGSGCCIKAKYGYDHFVCGEYLAVDVYTPQERRQNYIEEFGYAPAYC